MIGATLPQAATLPKTALITGAAKRIGRAVALRMAGEGFDIGVHYHTSKADAHSLVDELRSLGVKAHALQADLSDETSINSLIPKAVEVLGSVSVLINNASIFADDRLANITGASFAQHFNTNLLAPLLLSKAFAAQSPLPRDAVIINVIDQRVLKPSPPFLSYGLSKAALWHATRTMAQDLAPDIRVNAVGPGPTLKSIHQSHEDFDAEALATLLQKPTSPLDVAQAVIYLIKASCVTGQMICVDSGQHLSN